MTKFAVCLNTSADTRPDDFWIEFYDADDSDHAEEQALNANPDSAVVCVATVPAPDRPGLDAALITTAGEEVYYSTIHDSWVRRWNVGGEPYSENISEAEARRLTRDMPDDEQPA